MSIFQLPPNPPRNKDSGSAGDSPTPSDPGRIQQVKVRTNRFGELEEHELIHLIDALDDERSRARFRESIYISLLVWIVVGWFLIYGPRVLFHQPVLSDPIALMKQHDKERITYLNTPPPPLAKPPVLNQKTIQQIQKQVQTPPTPQPPVPQQAPPPQEQARTTAPPVPQPAIPLPAAPRPAPSVDLPSAPHPAIASNSQSAHNSLEDAMRGAFSGRGGADVDAPGSAGPLQAGAQILSDVGDWDPTAYMRRLHNDIQRNWDPLIPEEVQPPLMKKGMVGIRFIILRDGEISGPGAGGQPVLETPSGDVALDHAAWSAIISEGQFPPLPKEYHGQQLELRVGFFYNEQMHQ
jgi:outer membrane biosynthesis protein TonB